MKFYRNRYGLTYPLPYYEDWLSQQQVPYGTIATAARPDYSGPDAARIYTTQPDTVTSSDSLVQSQQLSCVQTQERLLDDEVKILVATWKSYKNMLDTHNSHAA